MQFRKDINGLRALAVIPVLLFHFNSTWSPGGFAGVDVFFVISGYLMTGIIVRGIESNSFSLSKFYFARAKRILPALTALCAFLLIFGWLYLVPDDFRRLGRHVASTLTFLSNIIYWKEIGYFAPASQEKWLLHSWSLSVEWQFYMLYPIALVFIRKFMSLNALKKIIVAGTVLGYIFSIIATDKWPTAAYFLLPTRVWELMLGGIAFLYPFTLPAQKQKLMERIGLGLLLCSYAFFSKDSVDWPGALSIIPSLGAFLIIQAQRTESIVTTNKLFQSIGTCSYSLYLWHWPFAAALYYFSLPQRTVLPAVILSVVFAYLSNRLIEQRKLRDISLSWKEVFSCKFVKCSIVVFAASLFVVATSGSNSNNFLNADFKDNVYPKICHVDDVNYNESVKQTNCLLGNGEKEPIGLLLGDSYAGVLDPFIANVLNDRNSFVSRSTSHCFPSSELDSMLGGVPDYCKYIRTKSINEMRQDKYDVVFLAGRWESMYDWYGDKALNSLFELIEIAVKHAKLVYVVEQPVYYAKPTVKLLLRAQISPICSEKLTRNDELASSVNQKIRSFIENKKYPNLHLVTRDILYGSSNHSDFTSEGFLFTYDNGHLSLKGSIAASENFMKAAEYKPLQKLLQQREQTSSPLEKE